MDVVLLVRLQVAADKDGKIFSELEQKEATMIAVSNALQQVEGMGFNHPLSQSLSIGVSSVEVFDNSNNEPIPDNKRFIMQSIHDGNDFEEINAVNWGEAYREALNVLGWEVLLGDSEEE